MKNKVLIVEDSAVVLKVLRHLSQQKLEQLEPIFAASLSEAKACYEAEKENIYVAMVDLTLPDAPDGEIVDFFLGEQVPCIVLTASCEDTRRESLLSKGVVDYVIKESRYSYAYAMHLLNRIYRNQDIKVLVVEDSTPVRKMMRRMLQEHLYQVIEAEDGQQALAQLQAHPDVKLIITDYQMPVMDGIELTKTVRRSMEKSNMAIIGLSAEGDKSLSAKFIKNGANDFLQKPFNNEELHCRVMHNIEALELIDTISFQANYDYLTELPNRRYFFETGELQHSHAKKNSTPFCACILDLDFFKKVNDTHGHEAGDLVLKFLAKELREKLGRFMPGIARVGGEEFCILFPGMGYAKAFAIMDGFRQHICQQTIEISADVNLQVSFSAGLSAFAGDNLGQQIAQADDYLYEAKKSGRNMIAGPYSKAPAEFA